MIFDTKDSLFVNHVGTADFVFKPDLTRDVGLERKSFLIHRALAFASVDRRVYLRFAYPDISIRKPITDRSNCGRCFPSTQQHGREWDAKCHQRAP
jgi:hypothetical protein